jgi:hypothetical protein
MLIDFADNALRIARIDCPAVSIRCGRLATHRSGHGYAVHLPDVTVAMGHGDRGLTKDEAERLLDRIDELNCGVGKLAIPSGS